MRKTRSTRLTPACGIQKDAYDKWAAYGQSKTANILFSAALADRLKSKGLLSFSLHPGGAYMRRGE